MKRIIWVIACVTIIAGEDVMRSDFCIGRENGNYSYGCHQDYIVCLNGNKTIETCKDDLYYDWINNECLPPWEFDQCHPDTLESHNNSEVHQGMVQKSKCPVSEKDKIFEWQVRYWIKPCTTTYFVCTRTSNYTEALMYNCMPGDFFYEMAGYCISWRKNPWCPKKVERKLISVSVLGKDVETIIKPLDWDYVFPGPNIEMSTFKKTFNNAASDPSDNGNNTFEYRAEPVDKQPPNQSPLIRVNAGPRDTENVCANLIDGIYGHSCSRYFLSCKNHVTLNFICPQNTAFNVVNGKCEESDIVQGCQKESAATSTRF